MAFLTDFFRNGRAVELTATDYSRLRDLPFRHAKGELTRMVNAGVLRRREVYGIALFSVRYEAK